ncbi:MAG: DUF4329 domain-containing protein [Pseudomonadota bacterium]
MRTLALIILVALGLPAAASAQSRSAVADEIDKFVLELFDQIQPQSIAENREYCGLVGFNHGDLLIVTGPFPGTSDTCDPNQGEQDIEVIASYHTHGAFDVAADSEVPSVDDLTADFEEGIDGYVATPGGRVWLNLVQEGLTYQLCGRNCVVSDPEARPCANFAPLVEYTLADLRKRETEDQGAC